MFKERYKKLKTIGRGRYGEASMVSSRLDGKLFVMKRELLQVDDNDKDRRRHEVKALRDAFRKNPRK